MQSVVSVAVKLTRSSYQNSLRSFKPRQFCSKSEKPGEAKPSSEAKQAETPNLQQTIEKGLSDLAKK
jgi:hypothetical protein